MSEGKVCTACRFCRHEDVGYSEYTITGTSYSCLFGCMFVNDDEQRQSEKLTEYAAACPHYSEGTGLYAGVSVEDENKEIADWIAINIK